MGARECSPAPVRNRPASVARSRCRPFGPRTGKHRSRASGLRGSGDLREHPCGWRAQTIQGNGDQPAISPLLVGAPTPLAVGVFRGQHRGGRGCSGARALREHARACLSEADSRGAASVGAASIAGRAAIGADAVAVSNAFLDQLRLPGRGKPGQQKECGARQESLHDCGCIHMGQAFVSLPGASLMLNRPRPPRALRPSEPRRSPVLRRPRA